MDIYKTIIYINYIQKEKKKFLIIEFSKDNIGMNTLVSDLYIHSNVMCFRSY